MATDDVEIIAELLARVGGSWNPERSRPAHIAITSRHRDVARLVLAEIERSDAARNNVAAGDPEVDNAGAGMASDSADPGRIRIGETVIYRPPGDTRTMICRVEKTERDRAYVVPVQREIGWISTDTLLPLKASAAHPKPHPWPQAEQEQACRAGGRWPSLAFAQAPDDPADARLRAPATKAGSPPDPPREPEKAAVPAPSKKPAACHSETPGGRPSDGKVADRGPAPQPRGRHPGTPGPQAPSAPRTPAPSGKGAKDGKAPASVQHFFDSSGQWVAFRRHRKDRYLFNTKGKWIGWFPWQDNEVMDVKGGYLGIVMDGDRIYQKTPPQPGTRKAGFVMPPGDPGYAGYPDRAAHREPPYGFKDIDWEQVVTGQRAWLKGMRRTAAPASSAFCFWMSKIGLGGLASRIERVIRPTGPSRNRAA